MNNYTDYFTFVYKASANREKHLRLPDQWKALTCNRYFEVKSVDSKSFLFTPSMGKPKLDLLYVNEENVFENNLGESPEAGPCYWAGLGDEFLLIRCSSLMDSLTDSFWDYYEICCDKVDFWNEDLLSENEKSIPIRIPLPYCRRREKKAVAQLFAPHTHLGSVHASIKALRHIRNAYSLFAIALSHPDITTAGLAAAAIEDGRLLEKLAELCIHDKKQRKIGMYAAFRLGSERTGKLKAAGYNGFLKVLSGHCIAAEGKGFRLQKASTFHSPGYWRSCLSECRYEDRALKKIRRMTDPLSAMSYSAAEPFRDVYEEFLFLTRDRQDIIFWAALFWDSDARCLLATRYLNYRFLKIAAVSCNHEDRWKAEGFGWVQS